MSTSPDRDPDNGDCCRIPGKSLIGDPINPATGNVFSSSNDLSAGGHRQLSFSRFYNSGDRETRGFSAGWRHSFSREIRVVSQSATYKRFQGGSPGTSSLYTNAASACTSGFAQIKSNVAAWASATASFSDNVCTLNRSGTSIGTLPIRFSSTFLPPPAATPVYLDVVRDDGTLIRFPLQAGTIVSPPSTGIKLQQTSGGYALTDASDTVESYNINGKLLSITSREDVVQTMSYDTAGRLSTVTNSFGHQILLNYDNQGRLASVTRQ